MVTVFPWHEGSQEAFHHTTLSRHSLPLLQCLNDSGYDQESGLDLGKSAFKHYGVAALVAVPVAQG